jgi:hypothetical protein
MAVAVLWFIAPYQFPDYLKVPPGRFARRSLRPCGRPPPPSLSWGGLATPLSALVARAV